MNKAELESTREEIRQMLQQRCNTMNACNPYSDSMEYKVVEMNNAIYICIESEGCQYITHVEYAPIID